MNVKKYLTKIEDLSNRKIALTGGTSGIGLALLKHLVSKNAYVVLLARNLTKAKEIVDSLNYSKIDVIEYDQASYESIEKGIDFTNQETGEILQNTVNSYMKNTILNYLYKTTKEFNSDIDGFGYYALKHFSTTKDWNSFNWLENYHNSFFTVEIDGQIMAGNSFLGI